MFSKTTQVTTKPQSDIVGASVPTGLMLSVTCMYVCMTTLQFESTLGFSQSQTLEKPHTLTISGGAVCSGLLVELAMPALMSTKYCE